MSVRPSHRHGHADVVTVRIGIGWGAVERVEHSEADEEVLQDLAFHGRVELQALAASVAEARVVIESGVEIGLRSVIRVVRRRQGDGPLEVLGRLRIDSLFVVTYDPPGKGELRAVGVDCAQTDKPAELRAQLQPEALVALQATAARYEPTAFPETDV